MEPARVASGMVSIVVPSRGYALATAPIGDLDPARPGLEIYYGMETRQKANGMCMVETEESRKNKFLCLIPISKKIKKNFKS